MVPRQDVLRLTFEGIHIDGEIRHSFDALLRVVGTLHIMVHGQTLLGGEEFCLIEFAAQLARWLGSVGERGPDFVYTSEESRVQGLVRFDNLAPDSWVVSAYDLVRDARETQEKPVTTATLVHACDEYLRALWQRLPERVRIVEGLKKEGEEELTNLFQKM